MRLRLLFESPLGGYYADKDIKGGFDAREWNKDVKVLRIPGVGEFQRPGNGGNPQEDLPDDYKAYVRASRSDFSWQGAAIVNNERTSAKLRKLIAGSKFTINVAVIDLRRQRDVKPGMTYREFFSNFTPGVDLDKSINLCIEGSRGDPLSPWIMIHQIGHAVESYDVDRDSLMPTKDAPQYGWTRDLLYSFGDKHGISREEIAGVLSEIVRHSDFSMDHFDRDPTRAFAGVFLACKSAGSDSAFHENDNNEFWAEFLSHNDSLRRKPILLNIVGRRLGSRGLGWIESIYRYLEEAIANSLSVLIGKVVLSNGGGGDPWTYSLEDPVPFKHLTPGGGGMD